MPGAVSADLSDRRQVAAGLGSEEFKKQMLAPTEGRMGDHHSGELRREAAEAKAQRIKLLVERLDLLRCERSSAKVWGWR